MVQLIFLVAQNAAALRSSTAGRRPPAPVRPLGSRLLAAASHLQKQRWEATNQSSCKDNKDRRDTQRLGVIVGTMLLVTMLVIIV